MVSAITQGIKVSVESKYEAEHSDPTKDSYVHSYRITIDNNSDRTVQLLRRHWIIIDALLNIKQVKGDGVIGEQPVLYPGASHSYSSWTPINTTLGKMFGSYQMIDINTSNEIEVSVPAFILSTDGLRN